MKWAVKQLESALNGVVENLPPLIFVYGDDGGAVRQHAQALAAHIAPDQDDPFLSDKISVEDIAETPSCLLDSTSTISFGGGMRLVRLSGVNGDLPRAQMDAVTNAVKDCLAAPQEGSVVVIAAPGVDKSSALARAVEKSKEAAAVRCFQASLRDLTSHIQGFFREQGKTVEPEAMLFLKENLGNDRDITLQELDKLALYTAHDSAITLEHCLQSVTSAPSMSVFKLCDALGKRDSKQVDIYMRMLKEEGADFYMISMLVLRHLRRLLEANEMVAEGMTADQAMGKLKPPVFFGKQEFAYQMRVYPLPRLRRIFERFYQMQLESRQGYLPAEMVFERGILGLSL